MGILGAADQNTPLKSKARRWLTKQAQHSQMPTTPIASSESPVQPQEAAPLLGTALRSFEKNEKLGITFQDTGRELTLKVVGLKLGSQGLEQAVKVSAHSAQCCQVPAGTDPRCPCVQMGWQVSEVNGVSLEGMDFKRSMECIANPERPLRVLFRTPLMEGDAAKEAAGAAAASPSVAVEETKRRFYERDAAAAGGFSVAEVVTSSRNLISLETPTKDLKIQADALHAEISKLDSKKAAPARDPPPAPAHLDSALARVNAGLEVSAAAGPEERAPAPAPTLVDSEAAASSKNPFGTATAIASPKEAIVEKKKRLYAYDPKTGGVACASVSTECSNLLAAGSTPLKRDGVFADETSSSPAPNTYFDSGSGPYEMVVWHQLTEMRVSAKSATGDIATVADFKHALLRQAVAAHPGLLKAPLRIVEVTPVSSPCCPAQRTELADEAQLKPVYLRQKHGKQTLLVENAEKPPEPAAAKGPTLEEVTDGGSQVPGAQTTATLPSEAATHPPVTAGTVPNEAAPDLFTFESPAPFGAPSAGAAAAAQALAAQLFASPATAPSTGQAGADRSSNVTGSCQSMEGCDWVTFDTPIK